MADGLTVGLGAALGLTEGLGVEVGFGADGLAVTAGPGVIEGIEAVTAGSTVAGTDVFADHPPKVKSIPMRHTMLAVIGIK